MKIFSPMITGNGAWMLHKAMSETFENYCLTDINPYSAIFSPFLYTFRPEEGLYDVFHSAPDLGSWIIPKDIRVVHTFHNFYYDSCMIKKCSFSQRMYYLSLLKWSIQSACMRSDVIVCVSDFIANLVTQYLPEYRAKVTVIKNGIDTSLFLPRAKPATDIVKILFAGNPTKRKGVDLLFKLADELPKNCVLQATSGARDISSITHPNIEWLGKVPHHEMPLIYQNADILFFPTFREGLSLVTLEAMSCGLPIVSTLNTSQSEAICSEKGGILCDYNDFPSMVTAIRRLADNPELRCDMGAYNRERAVREFDIKRMCNEYLQVFNS